MRILKKDIKAEVLKAQKGLDFCWNVLGEFKNAKDVNADLLSRFPRFQEVLAETIFNLHAMREKIVKEEKLLISKKKRYSPEWFKGRLRLLAAYKNRLDSIVNIGKALGDAYAYFFYQFDLPWLEEHLSHPPIINQTAGIGEKGELELIRNVKQLDGLFTLHHGITNILRYGDFSFVDLKQLRVVQIGELKTKKGDENTLELNLTVIRHTRIKVTEKTVFRDDSSLPKNRRGRQIKGIIDFLENIKKKNSDPDLKIYNDHYFEEINSIYKQTKTNCTKIQKVSSGLAFSASRFAKAGLFHKLFVRNQTSVVTREAESIQNTAMALMRKESKYNSLIYTQLLYNPDTSVKVFRGIVPLFWCPLNLQLLQKLYFLEFYMVVMFNPTHLIEQLQDMGFRVDSKYPRKETPKATHVIQYFDLFITYIVDFLLTESFVVDCINEFKKLPEDQQVNAIRIKMQQVIRLMPF